MPVPVYLAEPLDAEWKGRHLPGFEARLKAARFPSVKTIEQLEHFIRRSEDILAR